MFSSQSDEPLYIGQATSIALRLIQHRDADSQLSRAVSALGFTGAADARLRIRVLRVAFGRLELEEFAVVNHGPRLNRMRRSSRRRVSLAANRSLWNQVQERAETLVAAGANAVEAAAWSPWGTVVDVRAGGIYMIRSQAEGLLYVGESDNAAERLSTHASTSSYFSSVRRNVERTLLGLQYGAGLRRRFVDSDEGLVTAFLADCSSAVIPVAIGRGEVESALIAKLQPRLNRRR